MDRTCRVFFRTDAVWTDCIAPGPTPEGEDCEGDSECARGLFCPKDKCAAYCRRQGQGGCSGDGKCKPIIEGDVQLGPDRIGFCDND